MSTPLKQSGIAKVVSYRIAEKEKKIIEKKWGTLSKFFNDKIEKELMIIDREFKRKRDRKKSRLSNKEY